MICWKSLNTAKSHLKAARNFYKARKTSRKFLKLQKTFRINLELPEASTSILSTFFTFPDVSTINLVKTKFDRNIAMTFGNINSTISIIATNFSVSNIVWLAPTEKSVNLIES